MDTLWFERRPGEFASPCTDESETGAVLVMHPESSPDWVRLPADLGGTRLRVLKSFTGPCPKCESQVKHMELAGGYYVAECRAHGFLWYRLDGAG